MQRATAVPAIQPGYSHLDYWHAVTAAPQADVFVQVRKKGVTLCGLVVEPVEFRDRSQWFKVQTEVGTEWRPASQVHPCSGAPGRCLCAEDAAAGVPARCAIRCSEPAL
jgi:hypothetical protein